MMGCNFTMEPDPGATLDNEANAADAIAGRAYDAGEMGGGGQLGPAANDMSLVPPEFPDDFADGGIGARDCHDAGVPPDSGVGDAGLTDGATSDAGPTCDMFMNCGDADTDDGGACAPAPDGGADGG